MPGESAIEVSGVTKSFGRDGTVTNALDAVSLSVRRGRVTGLVGPDGAGKTTLMRLLAGLLTPDCGALNVLGIDVVANPVAVQERIGYMPQRFGLYEDLTVQENLDLYADLQAIPRKNRAGRYDRLFQMTGLAAFKSRLAGKLSGGMKQKLGLACALIKLPEVLLLDEPTVGVDPISRRDLSAIVREMVREEGIGVLLTTAYLDEAERCDDIFILNGGKIIDAGTASHFHEQVAGRVWEAEPSNTTARDLRVKAQASEGVIDASIESGRIRFVSRMADVGGIRRALGDRRLWAVRPRFEDAFMALLHREGESAHHEISREVDTMTVQQVRGDEVVVEVKDLTKRFGDFVAVDDISFSVMRGEVFGLLGPNGAGKTTTFRMLCGLLPASGGMLRVAGRDLRHSPAQARQRIGYMAQKFSMYGLLSVQENMRFYGRAYGLRGDRLEQRVMESLEQFDLMERMLDAADALPGGYRQRLAMAVALLHQPDVLFLDEPTSGVDPLARREFWTRITAAARTGVTVIVTTHFMEEAEYCDRMLILSRGRPLALGKPGDIREQGRDDEHPDPTIEDAFIKLAEAAPSASGGGHG